MKKIIYLIATIFVLLSLNSCGTTTYHSYESVPARYNNRPYNNYDRGNVGYDRGRGYQQDVDVIPTTDDISFDLDLRAVANAFANSRNLEQFERRINDYKSRINNLDLNDDGEVDYLRVVETREGYTNLVVIQAVLSRTVYQDVASIVLERNRNRSRVSMQVIGDPYIYGNNYILEPLLTYNPPIFSFFWTNRYRRWSSPYYWNHYPRYYTSSRPYPSNVYIKNINVYINNGKIKYNYGNRIRSERYQRMRRGVSRRDYARTNVKKSFIERNKNVKVTNRRELYKKIQSRSKISGKRKYSGAKNARWKKQQVKQRRNQNKSISKAQKRRDKIRLRRKLDKVRIENSKERQRKKVKKIRRRSKLRTVRYTSKRHSANVRRARKNASNKRVFIQRNSNHRKNIHRKRSVKVKRHRERY